MQAKTNWVVVLGSRQVFLSITIHIHHTGCGIAGYGQVQFLAHMPSLSMVPFVATLTDYGQLRRNLFPKQVLIPQWPVMDLKRLFPAAEHAGPEIPFKRLQLLLVPLVRQ